MVLLVMKAPSLVNMMLVVGQVRGDLLGDFLNCLAFTFWRKSIPKLSKF